MEGIRLSAKEGRVILEVSKNLAKRLEVPVFMYKLPSTRFSKTAQEGSGLTFDSKEKVTPIGDPEKFNSVTEVLKLVEQN